MSEVLSETVLSSNPPITTATLETEEVKTILDDAVKVAEERLMSTIPEPPKVPEPKPVPIKKVEPIPVSTTYEGKAAEGQDCSHAFHNVLKDSFKPDPSPLIEKWVLGYAKKNMGEIDVDKCASELKILSKDVLRALESLHLKGKIKIQT